MLKKRWGIVLLALCLAVMFTGCEVRSGVDDLKENLLDGIDHWMQSLSKFTLTKEKDLQGAKKKGIDDYTGTYEADYREFNGEEALFGGTAWERKNGNCLDVTYELTIESGTAELTWISGNDQYTMASESTEGTKTYTLSAGDNYLVLQGENFTGRLDVTVKDRED